MALTLADALVNISADDSKLNRAFKKSRSKTKSFVGNVGSSLKRGLTTALKGLAIGAAAALGVLAVAFRDVTKLARTQRDAERQLNQVIESTGGAAGLTAEQVKDMASGLQDVTNFGDETILQGQNLLLTFKNIGEDVFPRTTETMLDMSTALDQDMKQSAIQLGKALNDPITGLSNLREVGITFTEEQEKQIKALQESGDLMGAQTIILEELESQFGGSARAMADPAIQARNKWGDFKEMIGSVVLTVQGALAERALPILQGAMETLEPILAGVSRIIDTFFMNADAGIPFLENLSRTLLSLGLTLGMSREKAAGLRDGVMGLVQWFMQARATVSRLWGQLMKLLAPVIEAITQFVSWKDVLITLGIALAAVIIPIIGSLITSIAPVIAVVLAVMLTVAALRRAWESNFLGIQEKTRAVITFVRNLITRIMNGIKTFWAANGDAILAKARQIWTTIQLVVTTVINTVKAILAAVTGAILSAWNKHGDQVLASAKRFWNAIKGFIEATIGFIMNNIIIPIANAIAAFWAEHGEAIRAGAEEAWSKVQEIIDAGMANIATLLDTFAALFSGDWEGFLDGIKELWEAAWENVEMVIEAFWEFLSPIIAGIISEITEALEPTIESLQGKFETVMGAISEAISPVVEVWTGFVDAIKGFWNWLKGKVFSFNINLPDVPDWALPGGSPTPLQRAWESMEQSLNRMTIAPAFSPEMLGPLKEVNHFHLQANYRFEDENSLTQRVRTLDMLRNS